MKRVLAKGVDSPTLMVMANLLAKSALILLIAPVGLRLLPEEFGVIWLLATNLFSLTLLFDLGISAIVSRHVTVASTTQTGLALTATVIQASRAIYAKLAYLYLLLLAGLSSYLLLHALPTQRLMLSTCLAVSAVGGCLYLRLNYRFAVLVGQDHVALANRIQSLCGLFAYPLSLLALWLIREPAIALAILYVGLVAPLLWFSRYLPVSVAAPAVDEAICQTRIKRDVIRAATGVLMSLVVYNMASYYYSSHFASTQGLVSALLLLQLLRGIASFAQSPFYSRLPYINALHAGRRKSECYRYSTQRIAIALLLQVVLSICVYIFFANPATAILALIPADAPTGFYLTLTLALLTERLAAMLLQVYTASGHVIWHITNGLSGLAQIALTLLLAAPLGLLSFPVALLLACLCIQIPIVAYHLRRDYIRTDSGRPL